MSAMENTLWTARQTQRSKDLARLQALAALKNSTVIADLERENTKEVGRRPVSSGTGSTTAAKSTTSAAGSRAQQRVLEQSPVIADLERENTKHSSYETLRKDQARRQAYKDLWAIESEKENYDKGLESLNAIYQQKKAANDAVGQAVAEAADRANRYKLASSQATDPKEQYYLTQAYQKAQQEALNPVVQDMTYLNRTRDTAYQVQQEKIKAANEKVREEYAKANLADQRGENDTQYLLRAAAYGREAQQAENLRDAAQEAKRKARLELFGKTPMQVSAVLDSGAAEVYAQANGTSVAQLRAAAEAMPEVAELKSARARSEAVDAILAEKVTSNSGTFAKNQPVQQAIDTYNGVKHTSGEDFRAMLRQTLGDNAIGLVKEEIAPMETTGYNGIRRKFATKEAEQDSDLRKTLNQIVLGNWTDDVTPAGTMAQIGLGLLGVDLPMDARDLAYDLTHWEQTPEHLKQTLIDLAAILPVVGGLKYLDEGAALVKGGLKNANVAVDVAGDAAKGANKVVSESAGKSVAKIGDDFGKLGKLTENPGLSADWASTTAHGTMRMAERGVTQSMVDSWVANGKVLKQSSGNYLYVAKDGIAVLNQYRELVTTYTKAEFDANMWKVIMQLFGE